MTRSRKLAVSATLAAALGAAVFGAAPAGGVPATTGASPAAVVGAAHQADSLALCTFRTVRSSVLRTKPGGGSRIGTLAKGKKVRGWTEQRRTVRGLVWQRLTTSPLGPGWTPLRNLSRTDDQCAVAAR